MSVPEELARREDRLAAIAEAKAKIAAVAQERFAREQTTYEAKRAARPGQGRGHRDEAGWPGAHRANARSAP